MYISAFSTNFIKKWLIKTKKRHNVHKIIVKSRAGALLSYSHRQEFLDSLLKGNVIYLRLTWTKGSNNM